MRWWHWLVFCCWAFADPARGVNLSLVAADIVQRTACRISRRIPGTTQFSDIQRHPENERLVDVLACRPEASLLYLNADYVLGRILAELDRASGGPIRTVICDLSASPRMDLAGVRMLAALQEELGRRGVDLVVTNAHGRVRDLMRAEGLEQRIRGIAAAIFWRVRSPALWDPPHQPDFVGTGRIMTYPIPANRRTGYRKADSLRRGSGLQA